MTEKLYQSPARMLITVGLLLAALATYSSYQVGAGPWASWFLDTDDFSRALKVLDLMDGSGWWDTTYRHLVGNISIHWTRPSDIAVLVFAYPLHWLGLSAKASILWASAFSPLVLFAGFAAAWGWVAYGVSEDRTTRSVIASGLAFALLAAPWFAPMRIDHHGLIVTTATLMLGFAVRAANGRLSTRGYIAAGVVSSLAVWVSIEELLLVGCCFAVVGLGWLVRGGAQEARRNLAMAATATGMEALWLFIERGPVIFSQKIMEIDRISWFHVILLAAVTVGWGIILLSETVARRSIGGWRGLVLRGIFGIVGAASAGVAVYLFQPQVLHGYVATGVDPAYIAMRAGFVLEGMKVLGPAAFSTGGWPATLHTLFSDLLPATLGLPILVALAVSAKHRMPWIALLSWVVCFLVWQGWPTNANVAWLDMYGAIPLSYGIWLAWSRWLKGDNLRVVCLGATLALVFAQLATLGSSGVVNDRAKIIDRSEAYEGSCPLEIPATIIGGLNLPKGTILMSYPDLGPAISWRADAVMMSMPNHRLQPGFSASHQAFMAMSDAEAKTIMRKFDVGVIALCDARAMRPFFGLRKVDGNTFGHRLLEHGAPAWLKEIPVEGADGKDVRVFVVRASDR